ncbi:MAG: hypothetical protein ACJASL_001886 [Paraglaciecola sp.]|jgi:hypothetical protein
MLDKTKLNQGFTAIFENNTSQTLSGYGYNF